MAKDKTIGGLLALIGGVLGLHWFYVGRIRKGIITLMFTGLAWWFDYKLVITLAVVLSIAKAIEWWYIDWHSFNNRYNRR